MLPRRLLVVVLLIPFVNSFSALAANRNLHITESVRLLRANETVHPSGSDFVFSWVKCVICDGYDARLYLQDISGSRMIPHQLKAAVTSLKISNVPPRTVYRFIVKRLPSDMYSSEVSGRSFSQSAPLPVENLAVRVLTNSSIQIEWNSQNADGFVARILENNTLIHERVIPDFSNHSIVNIENLEPETNYQVRVTAFYFPPSGSSISSVSTARVKTLPVNLPKVQLSWEFDSELKLSWKNPHSPSPVAHRLQCVEGPKPHFDARLGGGTDSVALASVSHLRSVDCVLETWYSIDERSKVASRVTALKPMRTDTTTEDSFRCRYDGHRFGTSMVHRLEQINGKETVVFTFSETQQDRNVFERVKFQYRLCERTGSCAESWTEIPREEFLRKPSELSALKPWTPITLEHRFALRCRHYDRDDEFTTIRSIEFPGLVGPVDPVTQIEAKGPVLSWNYSSPASAPNYFLVTYCTENDCASENVPGTNRSISLKALKENSAYYVTVQAVQMRDDRAYFSPTTMTSIIVPKLESSENVTLKFTEITNSSTVRLVVAHNDPSAAPTVVAYHIAVCGKPVPIWNDVALASLLGFNGTCESTVSTNSTIDLAREPWISYEVSVTPCYGVFDSLEPKNLTLPVLKQNPSPLTGLWWTQANTLLSWEYKSSIPSGFSISICPLRSNATDMCSDILAGPLDRQYHVEEADILGEGFTAFVTPFVAYEGHIYNGTSSELAVNLPGAFSSSQP